MNICSALKIVNQNLLDLIQCIHLLEPVEVETRAEYVRLEENPFILSEEVSRCTGVVTAHDLHQYRNRFHSIKLQQSLGVWLDILMDIDKGGS